MGDISVPYAGVLGQFADPFVVDVDPGFLSVVRRCVTDFPVEVADLLAVDPDLVNPQVIAGKIDLAVLYAQGCEGDPGNGAGKLEARGIVPGACNGGGGHPDRFILAVSRAPVGNAPVRACKHDVGIALRRGQRALGLHQFLLQFGHLCFQLACLCFQVSPGGIQVGVQLLFFRFEALHAVLCSIQFTGLHIQLACFCFQICFCGSQIRIQLFFFRFKALHAVICCVQLAGLRIQFACLCFQVGPGGGQVSFKLFFLGFQALHAVVRSVQG